MKELHGKWNFQRKREFIKKCLSYAANDREGTKIAEFRSKIIADYLQLSSEIKIEECIT
jgi:hypothetical protein